LLQFKNIKHVPFAINNAMICWNWVTEQSPDGPLTRIAANSAVSPRAFFASIISVKQEQTEKKKKKFHSHAQAILQLKVGFVRRK
jgi:hypothetical protein